MLNIAANYGGQWDIVQAVQKVANMVKDQQLEVDQISPQLFEQYLQTQDQPVVDLLIRTSGELRISNFLLWQIAYMRNYIFHKYYGQILMKKNLNKQYRLIKSVIAVLVG